MKYKWVLAMLPVFFIGLISVQEVVWSFQFQKYEQTLLWSAIAIVMFPIAVWISRADAREQARGGSGQRHG